MRLTGTRAGRALGALAVSAAAAGGIAGWATAASSAPAPASSAPGGGAEFSPTGEAAPAPAPAPAPHITKRPRRTRARTGVERVSCAEQTGPGACRVLFIGNSYTFVNKLPLMFKRLAASGHHRVRTGILASPGESLAQHVAEPETFRMIGSRPWNIVVLQERAEYPAVARYREAETFPAARELVQRVRASGARPLFFMTWVKQHGWPRYGLDYPEMQSELDHAYEALGHQLNAAVAPVGPAWWATLKWLRYPQLWISDGNHPTVEGSYLAACVFYAEIYRQSPVDLRYHTSLPKARARTLQMIAADVVLSEPARWGRL